MSAAIRIGYVKSPTLERSAPCLTDLSLNCVIRLASPNPVMQESTQASWACSGTCDWTKSVQTWVSSPSASSCAAATRLRSRSTFGSWPAVMACWSTTQ